MPAIDVAANTITKAVFDKLIERLVAESHEFAEPGTSSLGERSVALVIPEFRWDGTIRPDWYHSHSLTCDQVVTNADDNCDWRKLIGEFSTPDLAERLTDWLSNIRMST